MQLSLLRSLRVLKLVTASFSFIISGNSFSQQAWTRVPVQDVSATRNILRSITGTSSADIWAAGHFEGISSGDLKNLLMHWDGTGWQTINGLDLSGTYNDLWDITAVTSNDIWAVGTYNDPGTSRS